MGSEKKAPPTKVTPPSCSFSWSPTHPLTHSPPHPPTLWQRRKVRPGRWGCRHRPKVILEVRPAELFWRVRGHVGAVEVLHWWASPTLRWCQG